MAVGWQAVASEVALWLCSSRWPMWRMNTALLWQDVTNVTIYVAPCDKKGPMRLTFYIFVTNLSIFHPVTNMTLCAINGHWSIILWKDVTNVTKLQQSAHYQNDQLLTSDVTNLTNLWLSCYDRHDQHRRHVSNMWPFSIWIEQTIQFQHQYVTKDIKLMDFTSFHAYISFLGVGRPSYSTYRQQI